jgi:hypothetical protein
MIMKKLITLVSLILTVFLSVGQAAVNNSFYVSKSVKKVLDQKTELDKYSRIAVESILQITPYRNYSLINNKVSMQKLDSLAVWGDIGLIDVKDEVNPFLLSDFIYDNDGKVTEQGVSIWDTLTNSWMEMLKIKLTYKGNEIDEAVASIWIPDIMMWLDIAKGEFTYENNELYEILLTISNMGGKEWTNLAKVEFAYDEMFGLSSIIAYQWEEEEEVWISSIKLNLEYGDNNMVSTVIIYEWMEGKQWENSSKSDLSYNDSNLISEQTDFTWDEDNSAWIYELKHEYSYEDNGDLTMVTDYEYENEAWVKLGKEEFIYNNDYSQEDLVLPYMSLISSINITYPNMFNHMLIDINSYMWDETAGWIDAAKVELYYSAGDFSSVKEIADNNAVNVYPNPAADHITFKVEDNNTSFMLKIYNVSGRVVANGEVRNNEPYQLNNFRKGVYFYELENVNKVYKGSFIVK